MLKKKVLIIEDEEDLALLLKSYFTKRNFEVEVASTLKEGVEHFHSFHPDILFLDNNLPDGIGWSIAPDLAREHPEVFISMMSAFNPDKPSMPEGSKYIILEKPISFKDLDQKMQYGFSAS